MERVSTRQRCAVRFGHLGLRELLEPQLRRFVAEWFDAPEDWLRPEISFEHDLAVDALDLVELVVEAEGRFGVSVPEQVIDRIRTYGDLIDVIVDARLTVAEMSWPSVFVRAAVLSARREERALVTRSAWLSPYAVETFTADALRAGPGAKLAITVPAGAPLAVAQRVEQSLAHLASFGVDVEVEHEQSRRRRAVA